MYRAAIGQKFDKSIQSEDGVFVTFTNVVITAK
jgi:hypothetical protein